MARERHDCLDSYESRSPIDMLTDIPRSARLLASNAMALGASCTANDKLPPKPSTSAVSFPSSQATPSPEGFSQASAEPHDRDGLSDALLASKSGAQAWLQVAGSFALYFNHLGLLNSFGIFQSYYHAHLLQSSPPSAISWIGSLQVFCLMALGILTGPLFDLGHSLALLVAGTILLVLGFVLTSVSTQYWQILLSQGLCMGVGACCLSIPSIAIVPLYFPRTSGMRALAMGIACVGSGLGSTLYPLIFERLQARVGFGWAVRIMGLIALTMCVFATLIIRLPPSHPSRNRQAKRPTLASFWDKDALGDRAYVLFCTAIFFSNLAFFNPPYYLQSYALAHGMSHDALAPYLLAILNASSIPGRIVPSWAADRVGCLETFIAVLFFSSVSVFYWINALTPAGNISFAALYGFFSGAVVSLGPVVLTSITQDLTRLGTRLGMLSVLKGVGSLIGPPISGALLDSTGQYLGIQLFAGTSNMLASLLCFALLLMIARGSPKSTQVSEHEPRPAPGLETASVVITQAHLTKSC